MGYWSSQLWRYTSAGASGPGIAPSTPSLSKGIRTITASQTIGSLDHTILVDASGGPVTATLPNAAANTGIIYVIKKIDASANAAIVSAGANIDGSASRSLSTQYSAIMVQSDGLLWWILADR